MSNILTDSGKLNSLIRSQHTNHYYHQLFVIFVSLSNNLSVFGDTF